MALNFKIRKLNSLRGLASLIVIISHYSNETGLWGRKLGDGAGQFGVMLFFMLSAFLITYLYFDLPPTRTSIKNYVIARIARIAPLFLFVVISSFIYKYYFSYPLGDYSYNIQDFDSLIAHLLLFRGDAVLWSIQPEIYFYIFFAFVWFISTYFPKFVLLSILFFTTLSFVFVSTAKFTKLTLLGFHFETSFFKTFPYFAVGFIFGYLFKKWQPPRKLCSHFFVLTLCIIPILFPHVFSDITGYSHKMWGDIMVLACVSFVFFSILFLVPSNNIILENRIGDLLGSISFSMYLLHYPILKILTGQGVIDGVYGAILFFIITITISYLTFIFYESPLRGLIRASYSSRN
jgi:peptidoglycan/LPS O-acetylase OafA/YrhL